MGLTQRELADGIQVPYERVNELLNGKRGVPPNIALRLAKFLGTTPDAWMNMQLRRDLDHAQREKATALERTRRIPAG